MVSKSAKRYKQSSMSKVLILSSEKVVEPVVQYRAPRSANPIYPVLLVLVLVVGAACTIAWFCSELSLEKRASQGDTKAQYLLGKRYFDSAVSSHDYARASRLIRKSAEQGYAKAETALGLLYENGLGVTKSYEEAAKWLRRAADQGYAVAQNELGVMYAKGRGVAMNLDEAAKWCNLAANQGSDVARRNVELIKAGQGRIISQLAIAGNRGYADVVVQKVEADGITVSFSPMRGGMGMAKLKLESLPTQLKELCGCTGKQQPGSGSSSSALTLLNTAL
jgi:TPR repeat protein